MYYVPSVVEDRYSFESLEGKGTGSGNGGG